MKRRAARRAFAYVWCAVLGGVLLATICQLGGLWTEAYLTGLAAAFLLASFVPRLR